MEINSIENNPYYTKHSIFQTIFKENLDIMTIMLAWIRKSVIA